jgi:hypothetical protein
MNLYNKPLDNKLMRRQNIYISFISITFSLLFVSCKSDSSWTGVSPDSKIKINIELNQDKALQYHADFSLGSKSIQAIETSPLGILMENHNFYSDLKAGKFTATLGVQDNYVLKTGKQIKVRSLFNEYNLSVKNEHNMTMNIQFRVYNDGFAFRYTFPGESSDTITIIKELTGFNLHDIGKAWIEPYEKPFKHGPSYEQFYENGISIGTKSADEYNGWCFPATFSIGDLWIMLGESNIDGNYPASHLNPECKNGLYTIDFPDQDEAMGLYQNKAQSVLPLNSPWRFVVIGETPSTIIETNMVSNLAEQNRLRDTSWIKPGIASWSWLTDPESPRHLKRQYEFIEMDVAMGWEYNLIDANWDKMVDGTVEEAINYANKNGIGTLLWYNSGGPHNDVTDGPRDIISNDSLRKAEFKKIHALGVKGVKVDFFHSDKQSILQYYINILNDAALNQLMVNFHGCTVLRGWQRTYPNLITMEGVKGAEEYIFNSRYPEKAPWHNVVLAFTRNVVGSMDYTPVVFSDNTYPHKTTYGHELALSVVFESGVMHMADKPESYLALPEFVKDFLKVLPTTWDETKFISGYPGESILLARRKNNTWYLGALNGTDKPIVFNILLSSLFSNANELVYITDGENSKDFIYNKIMLLNMASVEISVLPYGGFVGIL